MNRHFFSAALLLLATAAPSFAQNPHNGWTNVRDYGAACNGNNNDTSAFRQAIAAAPINGVVFVPPGNCVVTDTLAISSAHPVSIIGSGVGSQIFQRSDKTLLQVTGVNALLVKDLFLGSAAISPGTSLIELTNSHHNRIDNVTMLGGYYGLHLFGSLLNTIVDLRSGTNFANLFFASSAVSTNNYWVFAERDHDHQISSNANTFLTPSLEGGTNGIAINHLPDVGCTGCIRDGQGSLQILGGTIEGVSGTALTLDRTFLPSSISGVHFEANKVDVLISQAANIRLTAVLSLGVGITGGIQVNGQFTRNIQISDSIVQQMNIDTMVKRFQLQNITTDLNCTGTGGIFPSVPWDPSVFYTNVGLNCT